MKRRMASAKLPRYSIRPGWLRPGKPTDFDKAIQDLCSQRERLKQIVKTLEGLQRAWGGEIPAVPKRDSRRGRKFMGIAERQEVSTRMKRYWAGRRSAQH
jgi:hypothetical protein